VSFYEQVTKDILVAKLGPTEEITVSH